MVLMIDDLRDTGARKVLAVSFVYSPDQPRVAILRNTKSASKIRLEETRTDLSDFHVPAAQSSLYLFIPDESNFIYPR